ncbi:hypothetical protein [Methylobacterium brachiatum]|uniref:hypothetical protein n=1 Tax=Methylobacterium brachiatum TaxID=269660 RepID=UPI0008E17E11|nr:hypothetical protein [Methylobacterium brachiatum]SFI85162.1 hypothetical protein SAMN02799642_02910 [Methylobacterium brachiatum]
MFTHPRFDQADRLATESVKVGLPLNLKNALADEARRRGTTMSGLLREAAQQAVGLVGRKVR